MTRMTWERFELTGSVEDYLRYRGIDWREEGQACAAGKRNGERPEEDGVWDR